ncbi:MAG: Zinc uptake regulation protein Zur, partial [uncultured Blastococcus sp.]
EHPGPGGGDDPAAEPPAQRRPGAPRGPRRLPERPGPACPAARPRRLRRSGHRLPGAAGARRRRPGRRPPQRRRRGGLPPLLAGAPPPPGLPLVRDDGGGERRPGGAVGRPDRGRARFRRRPAPGRGVRDLRHLPLGEL